MTPPIIAVGMVAAVVPIVASTPPEAAIPAGETEAVVVRSGKRTAAAGGKAIDGIARQMLNEINVRTKETTPHNAFTTKGAEARRGIVAIC